MSFLKVSRWVAACLGIFATFAAIGGAVLGAALHHGGHIALSCLLAGVALLSFLWWRESHHEERTLLNHMAAMNFAMVAGLALYANLVWALWAAGVPIDIGTVRDGRMGEHYWLGPFTLAYAVICYAVLHWPARSRAKT